MNHTLSLLLALSAFLWSIRPPTAWAQLSDSHADHDPTAHESEAEPATDTHAGEGPGDAEDEPAPPADAHAGHDPGNGEGVTLTEAQRERFGIVIEQARAGRLSNELTLPGEVVFNQDRVVHLVPRVPGIVLDVTKSMGEQVARGELLAVLDSRALADAKAEYLAAQARAELAETTFNRERALHESQVSSEQDFLNAQQRLAEARITLRSSEQKLHAIGLSQQDLEHLEQEQNETFTRYEIRAPIHGMVTTKHIALGESLENNAEIFTIVDLDSVWVNLTVYAKDLAAVRAGQDVVLQMNHSDVLARGRIDMVTPFMEAATRSATARVVLDNSDGRWIPGTFATGHIRVSEADVPVVVPAGAVQTIEGRDIIFVEHAGTFEMVPVTLGEMDRDSVEIVAGLAPGTRYVARGAFELKATVVTRTLDSHAGHGH